MIDFVTQAYQFLLNNTFFFVIGRVLLFITVIGFLLTAASWVLGFATPIWRLGLGLRRRKIAIASDAETFSSLKTDLTNTRIFREKNIEHITKDHLATVKNHSLVIVHYKSFCVEEIKQMLSDKDSACGMIFYYPEFNRASREEIPSEMFQEIRKKENTVVVNFRGRLLSDIINIIITTSYQKK